MHFRGSQSILDNFTLGNVREESRFEVHAFAGCVQLAAYDCRRIRQNGTKLGCRAETNRDFFSTRCYSE